jgi:hypothetical protein
MRDGRAVGGTPRAEVFVLLIVSGEGCRKGK